MQEGKEDINVKEELVIIKKCQKGELENFDILYERYIDKIFNFIYYKTHHKETAEDLTSITFTKVLEKIGTYKKRSGNFQAWIFRVARNTVIDYYRTKKENMNIDDAWDLKSQENLFQEFANKQQLENIKEYLKNYSSEQRDVVILRLWNGLSYKEISKIIKKSETNCKMIFSRMLEKIRKESILALLFLILK